MVRRARESRGWSQRRLAEVSGVSQPNLAAIETGTRVAVRRLAAALDERGETAHGLDKAP